MRFHFSLFVCLFLRCLFFIVFEINLFFSDQGYSCLVKYKHKYCREQKYVFYFNMCTSCLVFLPWWQSWIFNSGTLFSDFFFFKNRRNNIYLKIKIKLFCYILNLFSVIFGQFNASLLNKTYEFLSNKYIYMYAFSRRFYPKRLTVHSGYTFFVSMCVPWELNPQP